MKLINNEIKILESDDKTVTLSSHRIRQENKQWGKMQIRSIMLEHVTACEYDRKSNPILLIIGLVLLVFGAGLAFGGNHGQGEIGLLAIGTGLVLVIFYWITIRKGLIVSSPSTKIVMNTNGMKDDNIKSFIDKLEEAKSKKLGGIKNE